MKSRQELIDQAKEILGPEFVPVLAEEYIRILRSEEKEYEDRIRRSLGNFSFVG